MSAKLDAAQTLEHNQNKGWSTTKVILLVIIAVIGASILTVWLTLKYVFPQSFEPIELSGKEQVVLEKKIAQLKNADPLTTDKTSSESSSRPNTNQQTSQPELSPQNYSEDRDNRMLSFSQREFNALLRNNTDLSDKLSIHFSPETASAKFLVPLDDTFPVIGGKTLALSAGFQVKIENNHPQFILKGASLCGVPIPNAWLGNLKNVDLIKTLGESDGFWQAFAEGIEDISIKDGELQIKLKQ